MKEKNKNNVQNCPMKNINNKSFNLNKNKKLN